MKWNRHGQCFVAKGYGDIEAGWEILADDAWKPGVQRVLVVREVTLGTTEQRLVYVVTRRTLLDRLWTASWWVRHWTAIVLRALWLGWLADRVAPPLALTKTIEIWRPR
jgi:hypothetical protein